jgi:signal transduction histidine kinase
MKAKAVLEEAYSELKKAQQKLVEAEKMSSLGRFAAGAAHEIKNPLGIIIGGIEYLQAVLKDTGDTAIMTMEKVKDAALRTNKIIDALVRFSEPLKLSAEKTRLNDLVGVALEQFSSVAAGSGINFATEFSDKALRVEVDTAHARQAILNVLMNALDAISGRPGRITVRTREASPDELVHGLPSCVIEIIDTGEGIAITDIPNIFEPFFTTRRDKKQIGLGLSVARTLIRNNGGDIFVHSHKEKGTTAKIVLPLFEEPKDRRV